jgi:hypothetical protein
VIPVDSTRTPAAIRSHVVSCSIRTKWESDREVHATLIVSTETVCIAATEPPGQAASRIRPREPAR